MGAGMETLWVKTEPDLAGVYHVVLELGPDDIWTLDEDAAYRWVGHCLAAAAQAEYDAAVLAQLTALGLPQDVVVATVQKLRSGRPASVPLAEGTGLALVPGVSASTRKGFLRIERNGQPIGQWEIEDARQHGMYVVESVEVAKLDTAYLAVLREADLGDDVAHHAVANLGKYR